MTRDEIPTPGKEAFEEAINERLDCKAEVLAGTKAALVIVMDTSALNTEVQRIEEQVLCAAQQKKEGGKL